MACGLRDEAIAPVPTLLAKMKADRARRREEARQDAYSRLRAALADFLPPGSEVWVFGSLVKPGRFRENSDIDIAMERLPAGLTEAWLQFQLALRLDRGIDVLIPGGDPVARQYPARGREMDPIGLTECRSRLIPPASTPSVSR